MLRTYPLHGLGDYVAIAPAPETCPRLSWTCFERMRAFRKTWVWRIVVAESYFQLLKRVRIRHKIYVDREETR